MRKRLSLTLVVLALGQYAYAVDLLTDDFDDNSLDAAKWMVNTTIPQGGAAVTEQNMRMELLSRGHLATVSQFDPDVIGGLYLTGTWTVVNKNGTDFFQVLTRSDGVPDPGNCCGETQNGIEFFSNIDGNNQQLNISTRGGSLSVGQLQKFGTINATDGDVFDFQIRDQGGFLSFAMQEQGDPSSAASVTGRLNSDSFALNHLTFHNRENGHLAALDNVAVAALSGNDPVPQANVPTGGVLPALGSGEVYAKGDPGWDVTDTYYNAGNIVAVGDGSGDDGFGNGPHDPSAGVHNAEIARGNVNPASIASSTSASGVPVIDFSDPQNGSGRNYNLDLPFVGDTAANDENFTTRALAFIEITTPGDYTFRQSADDTTFLQIDTNADGIFTADTACCASEDNTFTFSEEGLFPIEFTFGENGGGAGVDLLVQGPGTNGNFVLLGDTLSGSPGIFQIETAAIPEPASLALWLLAGVACLGFTWRRWRRAR